MLVGGGSFLSIFLSEMAKTQKNKGRREGKGKGSLSLNVFEKCVREELCAKSNSESEAEVK